MPKITLAQSAKAWMRSVFWSGGAEHERLCICQLRGRGHAPLEKMLKIESLQWLEMQWTFCIRVCNGIKNSHPPPFHQEDNNYPPPQKKKYIPKFYLPLPAPLKSPPPQGRNKWLVPINQTKITQVEGIILKRIWHIFDLSFICLILPLHLTTGAGIIFSLCRSDSSDSSKCFS